MARPVQRQQRAHLIEQLCEVGVLGADIVISFRLFGLAVVARDEGEQRGSAEAVILGVQLPLVLLQLLDGVECRAVSCSRASNGQSI